MRVELRVPYRVVAGIAVPGEIVDLPEDEAQGLVNDGRAYSLDTPLPIESAMLEPPERAIQLNPRPRGAGDNAPAPMRIASLLRRRRKGKMRPQKGPR